MNREEFLEHSKKIEEIVKEKVETKKRERQEKMKEAYKLNLEIGDLVDKLKTLRGDKNE